MILVGATLLFSMATINGTVEKMAKWAVKGSRGVVGMLPIIFFILSVVLASIGPGNIATTVVLVASCVFASMLRRAIPNQVRIATFVLIIATFVTVVDYIIQAVSLEIYNALGAFIQLIVVNCIILGRAEAYASKNSVAKSIVSAFGMGLGFTFALSCLGGIRELLGSGKLLGLQVFSDNFEPWVVMILPPGGFIVLGSWLLLFKWLEQRRSKTMTSAEAASQCTVSDNY